LRPGRSHRDDPQFTERLTPFAQELVEDDARYYRRRSAEECRAAGEAASAQARAAHRKIASHYARMSRAMRDRAPAFHPRSNQRARLEDVLRRRFGLAAGGETPRRPRQALQATDIGHRGIPV
jgi:hypothetical protein